jgi:hypothetical protein
MLQAQSNYQLLSNVGAALPMKKTYLYSVNFVKTSMHSCAGLITEEGRGGKLVEKENVKKNKTKAGEGGREERGAEMMMMMMMMMMEEEKV